jgi:cyclophilin family peptidyl-prolyl cis-trans isomerase
MLKKLLPFTVLFSLLFSFSCADKKSANANKKANTAATNSAIKTGVAPVADPEIAVIEMAEPAYGTIKMELYSNIAPKMVERFKTLAKEGFYNGTTFHRVESVVIQGGDPNSKDNDPNNDGQGSSDRPDVPAEFSDVPFERGIVGAARSQDPNSANCQFYITMQPHLDWNGKYTVFGKVIEGMNNADIIAGAPTDIKGGNKTRPLNDIKIKQITFQPKQ